MTNIKHLPQSIETYKELQPFDNVEDMNASIQSHKDAHDLTQTDRDILDAISRYACLYKGVCYLSKEKIAIDAGFRSRRTAIRACKRLEALGIITQHETRRVRGDRRRSSNVIVITAIEVEDVQEDDSHGQVTAESHNIETFFKTSSLSNTLLDTQTREKPSTSEIIKRGLKHTIPTAIYNALSPFYDGQAMYDTYGILLRAKAKIDRNILLETYEDRYVDAFYNVIRLFKARKVRNLNGLLYTTWERLTAEISRQIQAELMA